MPLIKSASRKAVGENIKREQEAGKPHRQAIAIALSVQRKAQGKPARVTHVHSHRRGADDWDK